MDKKLFQILVAEDNPADIALIREALKHHRIKCDLQVVCDGEKALAIIDGLDAEVDAPTLDLLIVDMHLPRRNGDDILNRLRATRGGRQIPVIAMSGQFRPHLMPGDGLVYFLKPSSVDEFLRLGAIVIDVLQPGSRRAVGGPVRDL